MPEMPGLVCDNPPASGWLACAYKKVFIRSLKHCAWHSCRAMTLWESCMGTCRTRFPWDLSVAQTTNCAYEGVVMPVCSNSSRCPGICVAHKSGSTTFKLAMHKEFARRGTRLTAKRSLCRFRHFATSRRDARQLLVAQGRVLWLHGTSAICRATHGRHAGVSRFSWRHRVANRHACA